MLTDMIKEVRACLTSPQTDILCHSSSVGPTMKAKSDRAHFWATLVMCWTLLSSKSKFAQKPKLRASSLHSASHFSTPTAAPHQQLINNSLDLTHELENRGVWPMLLPKTKLMQLEHHYLQTGCSFGQCWWWFLRRLRLFLYQTVQLILNQSVRLRTPPSAELKETG